MPKPPSTRISKAERQRRAAQSARARNGARGTQRGAARSGHGSSLSHYLRTITAGPAATFLPAAYPDGDPRPSVTMNLRATYTLRPSTSGRISFIVGPFFYGALTLLEGTCNDPFANLTGFNPTIGGTLPGWTFSTTPIVDGVGQLPMNTTGLPALFGGRGNLTAFRPLAVVAECTYTGPTLSDAGAVTVSSISNSLPPRGSSLVPAPTTYSLELFDCTGAGNIGSMSSMPSSRTFPARKSFNVRVLPANPAYTSSEPVLIRDDDGQPLSFYRSAAAAGVRGSTDGVPASPYSVCCPWKGVTYAGLDAFGSITVCVRYAVQCIVDDSSSLASVAAPSPAPTHDSAVRVETVACRVPTVEPAQPGFLDRLQQIDWASAAGRAARAYVRAGEL